MPKYLYFLLFFETYRLSGRARGCLHLQAQRVWLEEHPCKGFLETQKVSLSNTYIVSYSSQTPCTSDTIQTYLACIVCYCKRGVEVQPKQTWANNHSWQILFLKRSWSLPSWTQITESLDQSLGFGLRFGLEVPTWIVSDSNLLLKI